MATQTALTGLQPTGDLHIGNYIGAIQPTVEMQGKYECILFVADLHAMTIPFDPKTQKERTLNLVRLYLAAGINPDKCLIFLQSQVPQHTELAWILSTVLPLAELERMTQFKEKSNQHQKVNVGLMTYPVLMAADILLYKPDLIPVGQDQVQHVELTRKLARKFNNQFGEVFKLPKASLREGARIIGLDGKGKMSKSLGNALGLLDTPEEIRKKIRKAVVKPILDDKYEGRRPITIFEWHDLRFPSATTKSLSKQCHVENRNCESYKELVAKNLAEYLAPLQKKYKELEDKGEDYLLRILNSHAEEARKRAEVTMEVVRTKVGLR